MTKKRAGSLSIGPLSPKGVGRHFQPPPLELDAPTKVTNATSKGTYSAKRDLGYRGQDVRLPSKGWRC